MYSKELKKDSRNYNVALFQNLTELRAYNTIHLS